MQRYLPTYLPTIEPYLAENLVGISSRGDYKSPLLPKLEQPREVKI